MGMTIRHRWVHRVEERGAELVEFSLVVVILMAITLGMVSGGIVYTKKLALRTSAREGARYGATLPVGSFSSTSAWLEAVASATKGATNGDWKATDTGAVLCVAYISTSGISTRTESGSGVSYGSALCYSDGITNEDRVQVTIQSVSVFDAVVVKSTPTLRASAVARVEHTG